MIDMSTRIDPVTVVVLALGLLATIAVAGAFRGCAALPVNVAEARIAEADATVSRDARMERETLKTERTAAVTALWVEAAEEVQAVAVASVKAMWGALTIAGLCALAGGVVMVWSSALHHAAVLRLPDRAVVYRGRLIDARTGWNLPVGADHEPDETQGKILVARKAVEALPRRQQFELLAAFANPSPTEALTVCDD